MSATSIDQRYALVGTTIDQGTIVGLTLTAFEVETPSGETTHIPFERLIPLEPAAPLVSFA